MKQLELVSTPPGLSAGKLWPARKWTKLVSYIVCLRLTAHLVRAWNRAELVLASYQDPSWRPLIGGFQVGSNWKETPEITVYWALQMLWDSP